MSSWKLSDLVNPKMRAQAAAQLNSESAQGAQGGLEAQKGPGIPAVLKARKRRYTGPSEAEFMASVVEYLELHGFLVWHDNYSRRNISGLPDLLCLRGHMLLVIETKVGKNKPTPEQITWLEAFQRVHGIYALVLYPENWGELEVLCR